MQLVEVLGPEATTVLQKALAPVVRKVDNAIHRINHYPVDSVVFVSSILIRWTAIYPVDNVIQPLNNRGLVDSIVGDRHYTGPEKHPESHDFRSM